MKYSILSSDGSSPISLSVERVREQQVASGKEIEVLCEGLMQRAFAGELTA